MNFLGLQKSVLWYYIRYFWYYRGADFVDISQYCVTFSCINSYEVVQVLSLRHNSLSSPLWLLVLAHVAVYMNHTRLTGAIRGTSTSRKYLST